MNGNRSMKKGKTKAFKVGGIWIDPMSFPFTKEDK
jgi:hypothetical protein